MLNNISIIPDNIGKLITITPSDPATGTNLTFDVPVHTVILPTYFSCTIIADATVTPRTFVCGGFDGSDRIHVVTADRAQSASETKYYKCNAGVFNQPTISTLSTINMYLSSLSFLRFGDSFKTYIINLQAGDTIQDIVIRYMQWIQE